ncbi:MAG TPA: CoA transferase [Alcanivoracaceae bacterium]|nr:CoA transferase [Alcanivoracaceae bacterium]
MSALPLSGVRVIEMGQLLAGPFTGTLLAYFGAEVIKIEPPKGDPIRQWRALDESGTSYWWRSLGRNKKCITLNLREAEGQRLAKSLIESSQVLVENFRPGTMEAWGMGPEAFKQKHPELVYARISGYGQTGPYAHKPGYASVTEGIGGLRFVNGHPGQAPVRPNLSLGDTLAGLHTALGIVMALLQVEKGGQGQVVDVALFEAIFNLLEGVIPEFSGAGLVREPSGSTITGIVPTNTYACSDGHYVVIGGNGDSIYQRLMLAAGHPELANHPEMAHNPGRVKHEATIDAALAGWCAQHTRDEILAILEEAEVPAGPIYSVADMFNDEHFHARELFETVEINGKPLQIPALIPKLASTPGRTCWPGPELHAHNEEVLLPLLGDDEARYQQLVQDGIIGGNE